MSCYFAATLKQSVSTRSKAQKVDNVSQDVITSTKKVRQRKGKSPNVKKNSQAAAKQSTEKESPDAKVTLKKSAKKKTVRRKLNLNKEAETEDQNVNESIGTLRDKYCNDTTLELEHNLLQLNATKDLDLEKLPNRKLQQKTSAKISPVIVTPKSTPPKLSLTPHRSNKTPKKSPISLGSPKTHSIAVPKLFKSPRKLSLAPTNEDKKSLEKSDSDSYVKKSQTNDLSPINDSLNRSRSGKKSTKRNEHKKSDINLNCKFVIVNINSGRKFSKSPKIVLKSPKSKSRKLKLSPSRMKKDVPKTSTSPGLTSSLNKANSPRIRIKKSPLSKGKNLLIKRRLLNSKLMKTLTTSQIKDVLTEPVVLLEKLSLESLKRKNILTVAGKTRANTLVKVRSPPIKTGSNSKMIPIKKTSTDTSIKRNSSPKLRKSSMEKSQINTNRISPRIKCNTSIQGRDILSVPLMSSTPQNEKTANTSLTSNTSITSVNNTSLNTRLKHRSQSNMQMSNMNENLDIKNESSLFDKEINNSSQSFLLNVTKRDTSYNKSNTMEIKQESNKDNTYELEQPQTINLRQMIKKRTSTDANISLRDSVKKAKVRFADVTFDKNGERKSINKLNGSRSIISHVNTQNRSNLTNSAHKSKNGTAKLARNTLISPFKRSSPRLGGISTVQLNKIQVTPKTFMSVEKKSGKIKQRVAYIFHIYFDFIFYSNKMWIYL